MKHTSGKSRGEGWEAPSVQIGTCSWMENTCTSHPLQIGQSSVEEAH